MVFKPTITTEMIEEVRQMRNESVQRNNNLPKNAKTTIIDGKTVWFQEIDNDVIVIRRE